MLPLYTIHLDTPVYNHCFKLWSYGLLIWTHTSLPYLHEIASKQSFSSLGEKITVHKDRRGWGNSMCGKLVCHIWTKPFSWGTIQKRYHAWVPAKHYWTRLQDRKGKGLERLYNSRYWKCQCSKIIPRKSALTQSLVKSRCKSHAAFLCPWV